PHHGPLRNAELLLSLLLALVGYDPTRPAIDSTQAGKQLNIALKPFSGNQDSPGCRLGSSLSGFRRSFVTRQVGRQEPSLPPAQVGGCPSRRMRDEEVACAYANAVPTLLPRCRLLLPSRSDCACSASFSTGASAFR